MRPVLRLLCSVMVSALVVAGCDGGDDPAATPEDARPGMLDGGRVDRGGADDAAVDRGGAGDAAVDGAVADGSAGDGGLDGGAGDGALDGAAGDDGLDGAAGDGAVADGAADGAFDDAAADGAVDAEAPDAAADAEVDATIPASCGDGVLDDGELCDDGPANSAVAADACRLDCRPARCGDAVVDTGEVCDDGPANDGAADACRGDCTPARCGDGIVDTGEGCDAGDDNGDAPGACRGDCQPASCGDGIVDPGEGCDDGMGNSDEIADACRLDCQPARCGDGVVDLGEGCDDGVGNSDDLADACRRDCQPARCGDGVIDTGELCDGDRTCDPVTCAPVCVDDCALDALRCDALGGAIERCAEFDGDPCHEWGAGALCAADEACVEGACLCVDECDAGAMRCAGDAIEHCRPQADGCLGWDPAEGCGDILLRCEDGACVRVPLVIDEVYYDAVGGDTPRVFTELWGPPGTPLDGLSLVGVNGNGGAVYGTVPLAGVIGGDGFYLVAHPDAEPALAAVADLLHRAVDWQNGPDSVQLRRGVEVIDAVGYGDFANAVFAGEGRPAPDVAELALSRDAMHGDTDDNLADFTAGPPTPRASPGGR